MPDARVDLGMMAYQEEETLPTELPHLVALRYEPRCEKTGQVRHKPGCATTKDSKRLEISDLGSRGIVLPVYRKKTKALQAQLWGYREADLHLCFRICRTLVMS